MEKAGKTSKLFIFSGLPDAGKSTLASHIAELTRSVYLRIDTIEQALKRSSSLNITIEGYEVAYEIARDNLKRGLSVVADSVNPVAVTRKAWRSCAEGFSFVEIEIFCSDKIEHQHRVESRITDIEAHILPDWQNVINREYEPWTHEIIRVDTAGDSSKSSKLKLRKILNLD